MRVEGVRATVNALSLLDKNSGIFYSKIYNKRQKKVSTVGFGAGRAGRIVAGSMVTVPKDFGAVVVRNSGVKEATLLQVFMK